MLENIWKVLELNGKIPKAEKESRFKSKLLWARMTK